MVFTAQPLLRDEEEAFGEGIALFNSGKYWHAHEAWEGMWNQLKQRHASSEEIALIQGLIQTAALLFHYEKKNTSGVVKQWNKLQPKLEGWHIAWGLEIAEILSAVSKYAVHTLNWSLDPHEVQLIPTRGSSESL